MLFIIKQTLGVYCAASHTLYFTLNNSDGSVFQQLRLKYPEIFTMLDTEKTEDVCGAFSSLPSWASH